MNLNTNLRKSWRLQRRKIEMGNIEVKRNGDHTEKSQHTSIQIPGGEKIKNETKQYSK